MINCCYRFDDCVPIAIFAHHRFFVAFSIKIKTRYLYRNHVAAQRKSKSPATINKYIKKFEPRSHKFNQRLTKNIGLL